jgi:hypothetical protein
MQTEPRSLLMQELIPVVKGANASQFLYMQFFSSLICTRSVQFPVAVDQPVVPV